MIRRIMVLAALGTAACTQPPASNGSNATVPPAGPVTEVRVDFTADRIAVNHVQGVADRATGRAVTADDPVRIASISKLVVALGVMRLVEAGTLDLDRDVSDWLGWRLRNPNYPDTPITLRLLLSHQSSITDHGGYVVPFGRRLQDALADPKAWDKDHAPGGFFRYTNLNFPLIASVIEKATGERFDRVMTRVVFVPLKLDVCYNWSGCSDAKTARAVVLYDADGKVQIDDLHGARPACLVNTIAGCDLSTYVLGENGGLFSPQGGMRISMRDLARIGQLLLKNGAGFLSPASMTQLRTVRFRFDGLNGDQIGDPNDGTMCQYGLATQTLPTDAAGCNDDLFGDGVERWGHSGSAYGLRSGLWVDSTGGRGVAYFTTSVPDGSKGTSGYAAPSERIVRRR